MSLRTLEIELNRLYDEIVARDDFVNLRAEQKKIEKLFCLMLISILGFRIVCLDICLDIHIIPKIICLLK